jgi:hypothetical protein
LEALECLESEEMIVEICSNMMTEPQQKPQCLWFCRLGQFFGLLPSVHREPAYAVLMSMMPNEVLIIFSIHHLFTK